MNFNSNICITIWTHEGVKQAYQFVLRYNNKLTNLYNNYTVTKHYCRDWICCTRPTFHFQVIQLVQRFEFNGSVHIQATQTHFLEVRNVKQYTKNYFTCTECKTAYTELPNLHSRRKNPASDAHNHSAGHRNFYLHFQSNLIFLLPC